MMRRAVHTRIVVRRLVRLLPIGVLFLSVAAGGMCSGLLGQSAGAVADKQPRHYERLILTDGSFESISRYERHGDRVRYFSTERNGWEELPEAVIDWPATEKYAAEAGKTASQKTEDALARAAEERREDDARAPEIAPGIRLPSPDNIYLLDSYQGDPVLVRLVQNGADLNKNTGKNILRGVINPIAGPRQTVELEGLKARVQSHTLSPSIYVAIVEDADNAGFPISDAGKRLRIVRCQEKKGNRVVIAIDIAIYGRVKQRTDDVKVKVETISPLWVRITPAAPLEKGEYALVEFDEKGAANQFVWDFGVNPDAPPNQADARPTPERKAPALIQKPRKKSVQ